MILQAFDVIKRWFLRFSNGCYTLRLFFIIALTLLFLSMQSQTADAINSIGVRMYWILFLLTATWPSFIFVASQRICTESFSARCACSILYAIAILAFWVLHDRSSFWLFLLLQPVNFLSIKLLFTSLRSWGGPRNILLLSSLVVFLYTSFAFFPGVTTAIGSMCTLFTMSTILLIVVAIVSYYARNLHFLSLAIIFAVVISIFGWNNNHDVRILNYEGEKTMLEDDFRSWIASRPDAYLYSKINPYPVFVVSAEGGGISAAYTTAMALSILQDQCPSFCDHVYCISSVSGGSVGAAVFLALRKALAGAPNDRGGSGSRRYVEFVERFFDQDFLAPVIASAMSTELLQTFVPVALPFFDDRSTTLEKAFEAGWEKLQLGPNTMNEPLERLHESQQWIPRIMFNATNVESGAAALVTDVGIGGLELNHVSLLEESTT